MRRWLALLLVLPLAAEEKVGYRVLDLDRADGKGKLTVALWYPTDAEPAPYKYAGSDLSGLVAADAALKKEGGPYPFFAFSHGYGGSGLSDVFFNEALARAGWIVAAPDHEDRDKVSRIHTGMQNIDMKAYLQHAKELDKDFDAKKYAYRPDDVELVIDRLLASETFGKRIDASRIAVGGHSFGGFTSLALCGALEGRKDDRIKAVLLFSPGVFMYEGKDYDRVKVPSMYMLGEREKDEKRGNGLTKTQMADLAFDHLPAPKYFLEVKGASHFSFNDALRDAPAARLMSGTPEQFDVIRRYGIAFLEKWVLARADAGKPLDSQDALLTRYRHEEK